MRRCLLIQADVRSTTQRQRRTLKDVAIPFGHDVDRRLHGGRPGGELAGGISGIGSDQADLAAGAMQSPQQRPGALAVLTFAAVITAARVAAGVHRDVFALETP